MSKTVLDKNISRIPNFIDRHIESVQTLEGGGYSIFIILGSATIFYAIGAAFLPSC